MRQASTAALIALAGISLLAASLGTAAGAGAKPAPSLRITFTGAASGKLADIERWILLENNECYLRRSRDQQVQIAWSATWTGAFGGSLRSGAVSGAGQVAGTEVRDTCDEDELPPDPPENWIQSLTCADPLGLRAPATVGWSGQRDRRVLEVHAPSYSLARDAVCTATPRTAEVSANVPISRAAINRLRVGASLVFRLGTSVSRFGDYTPHANCQHNAKAYDGYRSEDVCSDELTWSGSLRITRVR